MISRIGKYTVDPEPLGRGGFGVVYRAFDPDVKRPVAIKVLTEGDPELVRRFQVEVGTTGNLGHKNIVTVYECGEQSGAPYLVMELLQGQTLEHVIKSKVSLTVLEKVRIMVQVAEGLAFAHSKGVVHRDVKPSNIMLLPDGGVKIMDFGVARVQSRNTAVTREGFIIGTIPYMAPEQFDPGGGADKQTDIFSYGDVFYELLTGKHPFLSSSEVYAIIRKIKADEPEPLCQLAPDCPEALELLVHRAIAKDREVRYQTFDELLLDSEGILVEMKQEQALVILSEVEPLLKSGNIETAERRLLEVLELDPSNRDARQQRTRIRDQVRERTIAGRIAELLAKGDSQMRDRQFSEAVETFENAVRLNKTHPEVQARLSAANARLEAFTKANRLVAEARRDQQNKHLDTAIQRLQLALKHDPEHSDAKSLLGRIDAEIRRASDASQKVIDAALDLLAKKQYEDAHAVLDRIEADSRVAPRVSEIRARIDREKAEAERQRRSEQFNIAIASAREALRARDMAKAGHLLNFVSNQFASETGAFEIISVLRAQFEAQTRADEIAGCVQQVEYLASNRLFREAFGAAQEAVRRFPEEESLLRLRDSVAAQLRAYELDAVLNRIGVLRAEGKLQSALEAIAVARRRLGEEQAIEKQAREIERQLGLEELLKNVRSSLKAADYEAAISRMEAAVEYENENDVRALLALARVSAARQSETKAVEVALQTSRAAAELGYPDRAINALEEALRSYPANAALIKAASALRERIASERRALVAQHRRRITAAISEQNWKNAENAIDAAWRECGEEPEFKSLAEQVERGRTDGELRELETRVRQRLASNDVPGAAHHLSEAQAVHANDPRWKRLSDLVTGRMAFESAMAEADRNKNRGDLDEAERRLQILIDRGDLDDRASRLLSEVRERKLSRQIEEAENAIGRGDFDRGITLLRTMQIQVPEAASAKIASAYEKALARRDSEIARLVQSIRERLDHDNTREAGQELADAVSKFPGENSWELLRAEIASHAAFLEGLARVERQYNAAHFEAAEKELSALRVPLSAKPRVQALRESITAALEKQVEEERLKKKRADEEQVRIAEAARLRQLEEERLKKQRAEEEKALLAEAARLKQLEEERLKKQRAEEEQAHLAEAARLKQLEEESLKKQRAEKEQARLAEAGRLKQLEEERLKQQRAEEAQARLAEAVRLKQLEEERLKKQRAEEEQARLAEAARLKQLEEERLKQQRAEEEKARLAEEARLKQLEEERLKKQRAEEEQAHLAEAARLKQLEEERLKQQRAEEEKARLAEAGRLKQLEEERLKQQRAEEAQARLAEAVRLKQLEEERLKKQRAEEEQARLAEAARLKQLEEERLKKQRAEEEQARLAEAARLKQLEEERLKKQRAEEEQARLAEAARRKRLEEERLKKQRAEEEQARLAEAARRKRLEEERLKKQRAEEEQARLAEAVRLKQLEEERLKKQRAEEERTLLAESANLKQAEANESLTATSATPAKSFPWKTAAITGGAAIAAAVIAMFVLTHRVPPKIPVVMSTVEIRTDPLGATVQVGQHSCITPQCQFELPVGQYPVIANLNGYDPVRQTLTVGPTNASRTLDLTMQPVHHEVKTGAAQTGNLTVRAGVPNVLVFVDSSPQGRTRDDGTLPLQLEAKTYQVRVHKQGYQDVAEQRVGIPAGGSKQLTFTMVQNAVLELRDAPAGLEVRAGTTLLGQTNGSPLFKAEVRPGPEEVAVDGASIRVRRTVAFEPGRTVSLDWTSIAPLPVVKTPDKVLPPQPSLEEIEARDWNRIRTSSDPAAFENYLKQHSNGAHAAEARSRMEDLAWTRANKDDGPSLRDFMNKFPQSAHAGEANLRLGELAWNGVDKNSLPSVRAFIEQYPLSAHKAEAQNTIDRLEKEKQEAEQRSKLQRPGQEPAQPDLHAQALLIRAALQQFNTAFERKNLREIKDVWPNIGAQYVAAVRTGQFEMSLDPTGEPEIHGDSATVPCVLVTKSANRQQNNAERVTLQKAGSRWIIAGVSIVK